MNSLFSSPWEWGNNVEIWQAFFLTGGEIELAPDAWEGAGLPNASPVTDTGLHDRPLFIRWIIRGIDGTLFYPMVACSGVEIRSAAPICQMARLLSREKMATDQAIAA